MDFESFVEFLKINSGLTFYTISRKAEFTIRMDSEKLYFTPHSTMAERSSKLVVVSDVFNTLRETTSFNTSIYKNITVNASYILSLIHFFDAGFYGSESYASVEDDRAIEGYLIDFKLSKAARNLSIVEKAKIRDKNTCQACGYFKEFNGGFVIECHHLNPLSSSGKVVTELKDLVSLCPNCHRVAHLNNPPYDLNQLKSIVNA